MTLRAAHRGPSAPAAPLAATPAVRPLDEDVHLANGSTSEGESPRSLEAPLAKSGAERMVRGLLIILAVHISWVECLSR